MKANILAIALVIVATALLGCAPREKLQVSSARAPLPENCRVTTYALNSAKPDHYEVLATLRMGEKALSVSCSRNEIHEIMRRDACKVGANAIIIIKENDPDLWSTCYRATAELVYVETP